MFFSKFNILFALVCMFVICSVFAEQKQRKSNSALEAKKNGIDSDNDSNDYRRREKLRNEEEEEEDSVDDNLISGLSYADNRYSPFQRREGNYRTRSRWPAQASASLDDLMNGNDWSQFSLQNLFPSSSSISLDTNLMSSSSPSCYSLVDSQYPIFSDVCGAVPQARYSLPNTFGHRERWQVAQILSNLLSSSSDSSCTRSLRLLLCPVLFPPCPTRHEPPAVLPCQSYCRAIKARCAIPALDILSCEVLPQSSDLCPTHQSYGSFVPPEAFPSVNQAPSVNNNAFPSSNYPVPRSYSSLQSLLSPQGSQSTPLNLFNSGPFASDSLSPMLVDFPSRSYNNDYRQKTKYASPTRAATDLRPIVDTQYPTSQRPSSMVIA